MENLDLSFLPALNATLNGIATILIILAVVMIKQGKRTAHRNLMIAAFTVSAIFLLFYLTHYYWRMEVKGGTHTQPNLEGIWRTAYLLFLVVHIIFATFVPILAITQFVLAAKGKFDKHRIVGKITFPIWLYTGITGVLIYFILYQWFPPVAS